MAKESSVRGSGAALPGATTVTMQIWYHLEQAKETGLTFNQLVPLVEMEVPKGYAWRSFLRVRQKSSKVGNYSNIVHDSPTEHDQKKAVHYVIRNALHNMTINKNAIKRSDGSYIAGRKPKSALTGIASDDLDGAVTRKEMQIAEALRILRPARERLAGQQPASRRLKGPELEAVWRLVDANDRQPRVSG